MCFYRCFPKLKQRNRAKEIYRSTLTRLWRQLWMKFGAIWWSQTGSNRRPPACKAGALPAELWPLNLHRFCASALLRHVRIGRFICQCAALVNPFLLILAVFSAAGSLSGKNHANSGQLWLVFRCQIAPAHLSTSLPADTKAKSLVSAIYGWFGIVFHDKERQNTALYRKFQINIYSLVTKQKVLRQ